MTSRTASGVVDIAIAGGGVVGATLAGLLARQGFDVALIDAGSELRYDPAGPWDLRVLALGHAARNILEAAGAWEHIRGQRTGVIRDMHVWDSRGHGEIRFSAADLCQPELGHVVEHALLHSALYQALSRWPGATVRRPDSVTGIEVTGSTLRVGLAGGGSIDARLLAGADGADSPVRRLAGIEDTRSAYGQRAVVCTVETSAPHGDTARQVFLAGGPLAFLPLGDPHRCSIVWSCPEVRAKELTEMDEAAFLRELASASGGCLGDMLGCGPRASFPLFKAHARSYVAPRVALVGDAAHSIHPLAGQGANIGLLDAAALAEVVDEARKSGRDVGGQAVLRRYERWRRGDNQLMQSVMDGFHWLFGMNAGPLPLARNMGLDLFDMAAPAKRWIMRRAMGLAGDLPAAARQAGARGG